ncbi:MULTISPECIES: hypothetical protein [unclassified Sphingomonas]|uniref:hypothetical protein n=1 Tax=unclassified Sphingomonas TaxID=196159 RepID=UPI001F55EA3F|nr:MULTISPECIES: hypothetical protein [unclassified Sphingomonas]
MTVLRILAALAATCGAALATPASAQFFFQSHDMTAPPITGDEPGQLALPDATPAEVRANLVWNLRSALNVAALQCQFEPTLLNVENYNVMINNHKDELKSAFDTLVKYFNRTNKGLKAGQAALDRFGTRTYSSFTTVGAQYGFCQTASQIATNAAYAPRGELYKVAINDMGTLRNSLTPWGEQRFARRPRIENRVSVPRLDEMCWTKRGEWVERKCGAYTLTPR